MKRRFTLQVGKTGESYSAVTMEIGSRILLYAGSYLMLARWGLDGPIEALTSFAVMEVAERLATGRLGQFRADLAYRAGRPVVAMVILGFGLAVLGLDRRALALLDSPQQVFAVEWQEVLAWPQTAQAQHALLAGIFGYLLRRTTALLVGFNIPQKRALELRPRMRTLVGLACMSVVPVPASRQLLPLVAAALSIGWTTHFLVRSYQKASVDREYVNQLCAAMVAEGSEASRKAARVLRRGKLNKAIRLLEAESNPSGALSGNLAALYLRAGRPDAAIALLQAYLRTPHCSTELQARLHCLLGLAQLRTPQWAHAPFAFNAALALQPACPVARLFLSWLELELAAENGCSRARLKELAHTIDDALMHARYKPQCHTAGLVAAIARLAAASRDIKALLKLRQADLETAESLLFAAIGEDSEYTSAHFHLVQLLIEQVRDADPETQKRVRRDALTRLRWILLIEGDRDTWVARRATIFRDQLERGELPVVTLYPDDDSAE